MWWSPAFLKYMGYAEKTDVNDYGEPTMRNSGFLMMPRGIEIADRHFENVEIIGSALYFGWTVSQEQISCYPQTCNDLWHNRTYQVD